MKKATTIEEQINLLESRGIEITDKDKAKEILEDIGYFRLGFYIFPFEKTYPNKSNRNHEVIQGTAFEDIVKLYYFDFDLRIILNRYLLRVEIAFRTYLTYYMSINYKEDPKWFINKEIIDEKYTSKFKEKVYTESFKNNEVIKNHKKKYKEEYAPAWKTLEFMTLGSIIKLYNSILNKKDKQEISKKFGINKPKVFSSYLEAIRTLRNGCAHGTVLYDLKLPKGIDGKGPKLGLRNTDYQNLNGTLIVLHFILNKISKNRADEMKNNLENLYKDIKQEPKVWNVIKKCSGINY